MSDTKYRALRSVWYTVEATSTEVVAGPGDEIVGASAGKIADLLADGLIEEIKPARKDK